MEFVKKKFSQEFLDETIFFGERTFLSFMFESIFSKMKLLTTIKKFAPGSAFVQLKVKGQVNIIFSWEV
jgi:hypothetical protein